MSKICQKTRPRDYNPTQELTFTHWDRGLRLIHSSAPNAQSIIGIQPWAIVDNAQEAERVELIWRRTLADGNPADYTASTHGLFFVVQLVPVDLPGIAALTVHRAIMGHELLTPQEGRVFDRLGLGEDVKAVAASLGVAPGTIKTHCLRMRHKLQLSSQTELATFCVSSQTP